MSEQAQKQQTHWRLKNTSCIDHLWDANQNWVSNPKSSQLQEFIKFPHIAKKKNITNTLNLSFFFVFRNCDHFTFTSSGGKCAKVRSSIAERLPKIWTVCFCNQFFWQRFGPNRILANFVWTKTTMFCRFNITFSWQFNRQHAIWEQPGEQNRFCRDDLFFPVRSRRASMLIFCMQAAAHHTCQKLSKNCLKTWRLSIQFWFHMSETPHSDNIASVRTPNLRNPCKLKQQNHLRTGKNSTVNAIPCNSFLNRKASRVKSEFDSTWHVMWSAVTLLICVCHPWFHGHVLQHERRANLFGLLLWRVSFNSASNFSCHVLWLLLPPCCTNQAL